MVVGPVFWRVTTYQLFLSFVIISLGFYLYVNYTSFDYNIHRSCFVGDLNFSSFFSLLFSFFFFGLPLRTIRTSLRQHKHQIHRLIIQHHRGKILGPIYKRAESAGPCYGPNFGPFAFLLLYMGACAIRARPMKPNFYMHD